MVVDPMVPSGPRTVMSKNQVSLPSEMLTLIGVSVGDGVFVVPNPDRPGTLVIIPKRLMAEIFQKGWIAAT